MKKIIFSIAMLSVVFTSCKKDPEDEVTPSPTTPVATTGSLKLEFEHMVDTNSLTLNTVDYVNANNDTFKVTKFKYYISNIKLTKSDGTTFTPTESYYLVDEATASSKMITIANVPNGTYNSISFMIGVDSTRNVSGSQTGALDPANGMFWSWSSGYIMAKLEGSSNQSGASSKALTFHIGGFSGANSVLRTVTPSFNGSTANVSSTVTPEVHYKCDLSKFFKGTSTTNFATTHTVHMPGSSAKAIADNYASMFSVEHIHN
jgi:hypothetical protein